MKQWLGIETAEVIPYLPLVFEHLNSLPYGLNCQTIWMKQTLHHCKRMRNDVNYMYTAIIKEANYKYEKNVSIKHKREPKFLFRSKFKTRDKVCDLLKAERILIEPRRAKKCLRACAKRTVSDHPAHAQSIIPAFCSLIITFWSTKWFSQRTVKAINRLCGSASCSGPLLSGYARRHVFAWRGSINCRREKAEVLFYFILLRVFTRHGVFQIYLYCWIQCRYFN